MAWLTLSDLLFSDILMMVGLESLGLGVSTDHIRCRHRQVCSKWNEKILKDIRESQGRKKIMIERNERRRDPYMYCPVSTCVIG